MENQQKNTENDNKPVGYGSSIQSSGHGNRSRPQQPEDKIQLTNEQNDQELEPKKEKEIND